MEWLALMGNTTVPLMPSTVTTNLLLLASTANLLVKLVVGVVPRATAGVEAMPRSAVAEVVTDELARPNKDKPVALVPVMATLE